MKHQSEASKEAMKQLQNLQEMYATTDDQHLKDGILKFFSNIKNILEEEGNTEAEYREKMAGAIDIFSEEYNKKVNDNG